MATFKPLELRKTEEFRDWYAGLEDTDQALVDARLDEIKKGMKTPKRKTKMGKQKKPRLYKHDTSKTLSNSKLVFKAFMKCLKEGDPESATEVLAASLEHLNKSRLQKIYGIPRRTSYNIISRRHSPKLDVVAKLCMAIERETAC